MGTSDKLGIFLSGLCIVHCVLLPVIFLLVPSIGAHFLEEDWTHALLFGVVFVAALSAAIPGYRVHKHTLPLVCFMIGVGILGVATLGAHSLLGHEWEAPLAVLGSSILIAGHFINHKKCQTCTHHHD